MHLGVVRGQQFCFLSWDFYFLPGVPADSCLGGYLALEFQSDMCLEKSPFPLENPLSLHDDRAILFFILVLFCKEHPHTWNIRTH